MLLCHISDGAVYYALQGGCSLFSGYMKGSRVTIKGKLLDSTSLFSVLNSAKVALPVEEILNPLKFLIRTSLFTLNVPFNCATKMKWLSYIIVFSAIGMDRL